MFIEFLDWLLSLSSEFRAYMEGVGEYATVPLPEVSRHKVNQDILKHFFVPVSAQHLGPLRGNIEEYSWQTQAIGIFFSSLMGQIDRHIALGWNNWGQLTDEQLVTYTDDVLGYMNLYTKMRTLFLDESTNGLVYHTPNLMDNTPFDIVQFDMKLKQYIVSNNFFDNSASTEEIIALTQIKNQIKYELDAILLRENIIRSKLQKSMTHGSQIPEPEESQMMTMNKGRLALLRSIPV